MTHDEFDSLTQLTEKMTGRPWDGTMGHIAELAARQAEANEVLGAHAEWLTATRQVVEASGRPWNTATCRDQSRRDGDLAAPPEWIGEMSERLTPPRFQNR